jgi:hypothetical protein
LIPTPVPFLATPAQIRIDPSVPRDQTDTLVYITESTIRSASTDSSLPAAELRHFPARRAGDIAIDVTSYDRLSVVISEARDGLTRRISAGK